jgi:hypothetical protein
MSFFVQHGYGKSDKLDQAFKNGYADGVIIGPRHEKPEKLESCVAELAATYPNIKRLVDPQFYISLFSPANDGKLPEYDYYEPGLGVGTLAKPKELEKRVKGTLDFQTGLDLSYLVSPTVQFGSFDDSLYQSALALGYESLAYHDKLKTPSPLLVSFVLSEEALAADEPVDRWLDEITQDDWTAAGFYLIVARQEDGYSQKFEPDRLARLLYAIHVLTRINGFEVHVGYADYLGLLCRAAGATSFASGWFQTQRRFQRRAFLQRRPGGQQPKSRYSSGPLLNTVLFDELQAISDIGKLQDVLSGVELDAELSAGADPQSVEWTAAISSLQHWQTLSKLDREAPSKPKPALAHWIDRIEGAIGLYLELGASGVQFDKSSNDDHLDQWRRALHRFRRRLNWPKP